MNEIKANASFEVTRKMSVIMVHCAHCDMWLNFCALELEMNPDNDDVLKCHKCGTHLLMVA
jgi:hypothetical protein